MTLRPLTEHHLGFLSLKGGSNGSSKSSLVKIPHCWKSYVAAHLRSTVIKFYLVSGDIVGLSPSTAEKSTEELHSGIVTHVSQSAVTVAFDDSQDLFSLAEDQKYKLSKLANDVTYKRLKRYDIMVIVKCLK